MIDALRNHPSIVMWVPFNEGWGQHDTRGSRDVGRRSTTRSRPVNEASGWTRQGQRRRLRHAQLSGPGDARAGERIASACSANSAGWACRSHGHTWQEEKNWGYVSYDNADELTDAYVELLTAMRPLIGRGLSAAVYTQTTDVEIEVNGLDDVRPRTREDGRGADRRRGQKLYSPPPKMRVVVPTSEKVAADVALHDGEAGRRTGWNRGSTTAAGRPGRAASAPRARRARSCARSGTRPISGCAARSSSKTRARRPARARSSTTTRCRSLSQRHARAHAQAAHAAAIGRRCWARRREKLATGLARIRSPCTATRRDGGQYHRRGA